MSREIITRDHARLLGITRPVSSVFTPGEAHLAHGMEETLDQGGIAHARVKAPGGFEIWRAPHGAASTKRGAQLEPAATGPTGSDPDYPRMRGLRGVNDSEHPAIGGRR